MTTFLVCLAILVGAYFTYGKYLERVCRIDDSAQVPSRRLSDGVDFMPLPRWKTFLIQLLNIAGLGPIFGAILGAAYGPVAFLWITLGGVFMGAMHDFIAAVMSLRRNGESLPEVVGHYLGDGARQFMRLFSVLLMVLVGAVFMSQPAELIVSHVDLPVEGVAFGATSWELVIVLGAILLYYMLATVLPINKIIGRIYPVFGFALLVMALGVLVVLIIQRDIYQIPELTSLKNQIANPDKFPIIPMLFTTIACGAISGFHATQSPMMARCVESESETRFVFYGAMITESIIALIWAAIAMSFWGNVEGLNQAIADNGGSAAILVDLITTKTLGATVAGIVLFGVIACAITSGDTAFRSARLIVSDMLGLSQERLLPRILITLPLFAGALYIIFGLPFNAIWSYFAWTNQTLATITLWSIVVYLSERRKPIIIALLPALIMTYVCVSYIFISPLMAGLSNRPVAYGAAGAVTAIIFAYMIYKTKRNNVQGIS
ncbi:MAG: carbon starvation CstA family protein [Rikenellaceae bacterium]